MLQKSSEEPRRNLQYKQRVREELAPKCTMISARKDRRSLAELEEELASLDSASVAPSTVSLLGHRCYDPGVIQLGLLQECRVTTVWCFRNCSHCFCACEDEVKGETRVKQLLSQLLGCLRRLSFDIFLKSSLDATSPILRYQNLMKVLQVLSPQ